MPKEPEPLPQQLRPFKPSKIPRPRFPKTICLFRPPCPCKLFRFLHVLKHPHRPLP